MMVNREQATVNGQNPRLPVRLFIVHGSLFTAVTAARRWCAVGAAVVALAGCGHVEPWVKPYERAAFADPIMAFDPNPVSSAYTNHVYEAREGARGASGSSGGGCGCN
jgi:Domain of unknown function (DUF4266)